MSLKTKRRKRSTALPQDRLDRRWIAKMEHRLRVKQRRLGSGIYGALMIHPSNENLISAHVLRDPSYAVTELFGIRVFLDPNLPPDRYYLCADYERSKLIHNLFAPFPAYAFLDRRFPSVVRVQDG